VTPPAAFLAALVTVAAVSTRLLEDRFGDAYRAYCLRVRRWV
jgi:protein-S-isoprenylcysteine O-methyltransferase Ste14